MHILPQEIEVWYIIPAIRREFAREMKKQGMSQSQIARRLNISRAAISQYISGKRGNDIRFRPVMMRKVRKAALGLLKDGCPIREIQLLCTYLKDKGHLCRVHQELDKDLRCCGVCCP
ncbi:helix-turn-helix domain-containing protein [Candidatus Woesearchaeota archaeon]|nr:helix-turn-helix domain-containing protein [Candidatus Woesearchaeota archaeon]